MADADLDNVQKLPVRIACEVFAREMRRNQSPATSSLPEHERGARWNEAYASLKVLLDVLLGLAMRFPAWGAYSLSGIVLTHVI